MDEARMPVQMWRWVRLTYAADTAAGSLLAIKDVFMFSTTHLHEYRSWNTGTITIGITRKTIQQIDGYRNGTTEASKRATKAKLTIQIKTAVTYSPKPDATERATDVWRWCSHNLSLAAMSMFSKGAV